MKNSFRRVSLFLLVTILSSMLLACGNTGNSGGAGNTAEVEADFPTKAVEIVVPFAAGGNVDLSCRIFAPEMEKALGEAVVVQNREGGGATIGQAYVASANPDGYTMLAVTNSFVTNIIFNETPYDIDSIEPIGMFTYDPEIMLVTEGSDITSLDELIEKSKGTPLMHSTPGHTTSHHIAALLFEKATGAQFNYIHTNGSAEQTVQLAGGHAEVGFSTYGGAASLIDQGKIRVLGVASEERLESMPDVPTFKELGYDFLYGAWRGIGVPKGTAQEIKDKLSEAFKSAMESEAVKEQFRNAGFPIMYLDAEGFEQYIRNDYDGINSMKEELQVN